MNTSIKKSALPNITDWQSIDWQRIEKYVEKLQQRIYHAESLGEIRKVRDLQRMLINSQSTLLLSIKLVTQINKGKRTIKLDETLTPEERLAIPAIRDRIYQNIVKMALEPQWEARFEATSYGFRAKRNCHDAIERIFSTVRGGKKQWIFEGDFRGCFDNLNHEFIIEQLKGFPQIEIIKRWLKAGYIDNKVFSEAKNDTLQNEIISPLLVNIALHGMEEVLKIKYIEVQKKDIITYENRTKYSMARYAGNFVIMCETKKDAENIYEIIKPYLQSRGLELAHDTRITHISDGFDFLGFNIRRYKTENGNKVIIKPSKDSIKECSDKISQITRESYGNNVQTLINKLNPVIIGTANYWSSVASKEAYATIDNHIWANIHKFLRRLHPKKSWDWIKKIYFKPDKTGQSKNKWILTDPISNDQLRKMSWTPIVRHIQIMHNNSPYNKELTEYFFERDIREFDRNNIVYRQRLKSEY